MRGALLMLASLLAAGSVAGQTAGSAPEIFQFLPGTDKLRAGQDGRLAQAARLLPRDVNNQLLYVCPQTLARDFESDAIRKRRADAVIAELRKWGETRVATGSVCGRLVAGGPVPGVSVAIGPRPLGMDF